MQIAIPHKNVSRLVTDKDIVRVYQEAEKMFHLLVRPSGLYKSFYAIAHPQCEDKDPLRFFILSPDCPEFNTFRSIVIINPVIINNTRTTIDSEEGCASFPNLPKTKVQRHNKVEVEFSPLSFDENQKPVMGKRVKRNCYGLVSKVFQHEIDHLNAKYIYEL